MCPDYPRYSNAAQLGERGIQLVSTIVFDSLGWIFKRNHQEHDFGIDGQVEVVTPDGHVTGQMFAVQIKYGNSFLRETNYWGYLYRGEQKHFNYLANYPIPVLIILCDPESQKCYWAHFSPEQTQRSGSNWKLTVPFDNDLAESQARISELLPPAEDHQSELEAYWSVNELLVDSGSIHLVLSKQEVRAADTTRARAFFDRLRITKELALACQGKVEINFHGYDKDRRELFEIPEVRRYVARLVPVLPELFFFLRSKEPAYTLKLLVFCLVKVSWVNGRSTLRVTKQVSFETREILEFLVRGYDGLNQIAHWLRLPLEENQRISADVARCLGALPE